MTMTDPVADMLTRIRNANRIQQESCRMPASRMKVGIADVLMREGYIDSYEVRQAEPQSELEVRLKYGPDGEHVLRQIDRISKPGCRVYRGIKDLPRVVRGLGIWILSTPKGVLSDRMAREQNVGGEILCKVH
jgi:small subunit ribosomal protein S8